MIKYLYQTQSDFKNKADECDAITEKLNEAFAIAEFNKVDGKPKEEDLGVIRHLMSCLQQANDELKVIKEELEFFIDGPGQQHTVG